MTPNGDGETGIVLVNVLMMVALAAAMLALLAVAQEAALDRGVRYSDAAAADAAIDGGELSAITALRRDLATAPAADTLSEPWARIGDRAAPIAGGTFQLAIADAQGKLNLNGLARNDPGTVQAFAAISAGLGLPADTPARALALIRATGPIAGVDALALAGIDGAAITKLATACTALPGTPKINLNTAPEPVLAALVGDPVAARLLVGRRARQGGLTPDDLAIARVLMPASGGFTSSLYWVRTRVTIHGLARERTSLIQRGMANGQPAAAVVGRWIGRNAPVEAPALE